MIKILTFLLIQLIFTAPFDGMTLITSTTDREAFDGLTLITTIGGSQNTSSTFLIDNDENMINSWNHENKCLRDMHGIIHNNKSTLDSNE